MTSIPALSAPFIKRPVATFLLALTLAVCGIVCYLAMPVAPLPQMAMPFISVSANLPGASAETMASSVSTPLQRSIGSISGIDTVSASSQEGNTRISIMFNMSKNVDDAAREVQAAINKAIPMLPSSMRSAGGVQSS